MVQNIFRCHEKREHNVHGLQVYEINTSYAALANYIRHRKLELDAV